MLLELFAVLFASIALLILYFKRAYAYWKNIGVPQLNPKLLIGDFYDVLAQKDSIGEKTFDLHNTFKSKGFKFGGVYFAHNPVFIPVDPDIIKSMLQKDSHHFIDRGMYSNEDHDPLSAHLFTIEGEKWKYLRSKLSPTFTSGKMKGMFPIVVEGSKKLADAMAVCSKEPVDIKEILACFSTDVIASCAFGIECDSLNNPKEEFRKYGRKVFDYNIVKGIKTAMSTIAPELMTLFNVHFVEDDVSRYFLGLVKNNLNYRETNNVQRQDFFNLLIQLKNKGGVEDDNGVTKKGEGITFNELAAQAFVFFQGGFETSSTVMTFALYELSRRLDMQRRVRSEINTVLAKYGGEVTYESLNEMPYLEAVINESMRVYPPVPFLNRICTQDYKIPDTNITVKKGIRSLISVKGLHMDPEYFPNPDVFDPDRFLELSGLPFVFLPFGNGPRICIGMRFGLMQTKIGMISLLRNFEVTFNRKTKPLRIDPQAFATSTIDKIYLNFRKL